MDALAEPVTIEQSYLVAIVEELRGLRADIAALKQSPEDAKAVVVMSKKKKPTQVVTKKKKGK
jgi:hypothetical protein